MLSYLSEMSTQQPGALKIIGPIMIIVGVVLLVGMIFDPGGYFTKGYEENPPFSWEIGRRTPTTYRTFMAIGSLALVVGGIAIVVIVY